MPWGILVTGSSQPAVQLNLLIGNSAEWIVERPGFSDGSLTRLADYGTVQFTHAHAERIGGASMKPVDGDTKQVHRLPHSHRLPFVASTPHPFGPGCCVGRQQCTTFRPPPRTREVIGTVLAAVAMFAGTNVDDIVVLTVLFVASSTGGRPRTWQIVTGQYLGFSALVAISVIAALGLSWGSDTTTSSLDYLADLSAFDVPAVAATLAGAPQALAAPDNSQTYLIVEGAEGGGVELSIHSMAAGTGFMQVNPDGAVKKVFPP